MELNKWHWLSMSIVLVTIAQLCLKFAMQQLPGGPGLESWSRVTDEAYLTDVVVPLVIGLACYGSSVFCWLRTLSGLPLSVAYPSLALSYLLVYVCAVVLPVFDESFNITRLLGIVLVMAGVYLVSLGSDR